MKENDLRMEYGTVEQFIVDVMLHFGVPSTDAKLCADVLLTADLYGIESHGIGRFHSKYIVPFQRGQMKPITDVEVVREKSSTALLDAHDGLGMVASAQAMLMAMDKAKETGMGMVTVRNSSHYGIAGYWALQAVKNDMICITGTNARPSIAPTFGVENLLGTNPITFGMPTDEAFPFLLDCATSVSQRGKIEAYSRQGKALPDGWVLNHQGECLHDANQTLEDLVKGVAALVPVGGLGEVTAGYKGYGYATAVELLSSALSGGKFLKQLRGFDEEDNPVPYSLGHFFIVIDIEGFLPIETFKSIAGGILRTLRNSKRIPGADRIYTAWEKEYEILQVTQEKGILIRNETLQAMRKMANELGLKHYHF